VSGSGISWAMCLRQITTPESHHSFFTGEMPFLPPNQQHQSTEGTHRNDCHLWHDWRSIRMHCWCLFAADFEESRKVWRQSAKAHCVRWLNACSNWLLKMTNEDWLCFGTFASMMHVWWELWFWSGTAEQAFIVGLSSLTLYNKLLNVHLKLNCFDKHLTADS